MGENPYSSLPKSAFWKTGVALENPYSIDGIYKKKFKISPRSKIATAGSCFAQHISRYLKKNGYNVLDVGLLRQVCQVICIKVRIFDVLCSMGIYIRFVRCYNFLKK